MIRYRILALALGLTGTLPGGGAETAAGTSPGPMPSQELRVGFTERSFQGVNLGDAEAAFKILTRTVGKKRGYDVLSKVRLFKSQTEIDQAVSADSLDLAIMDTWSYLELPTRTRLEPIYVPSENNEEAKRTLLVTRVDAGLNSLTALQGRSLNVLNGPNTHLGLRWLGLELAELGREDAVAFFKAIHYHTKTTQAVLPVFFGKTDACLVDSIGFALMKELNPQVGTKLRAIATSEPLANSILCLRVGTWSDDDFKRAVRSALGELHLDPAGQQVLTLFKIGRLVPFTESQLDSVRRLHQRRTPAPTDRR